VGPLGDCLQECKYVCVYATDCSRSQDDMCADRGRTDIFSLRVIVKVGSLWILEMTRKKTYFACRHCKKPANRKEMNLYECLNCKKMVDTIITHAFSVNFADCTGNCLIDVIGEHA